MRLTSYFKGLIESMEDSLKAKGKSIAKLGGLASRFGNPQIAAVNARIEALTSPMEKDGRKTNTFKEYFCLDWDMLTPLEYKFIYPHPQEIFGMAGVTNALRKHGITTDSNDKAVFKHLLREAKLIDLLEDMEVGVIDRND